MAEPFRAPLLYVVGPTASGKSDFAIELAEEVIRQSDGGSVPQIISADSVQFYRELVIGSARPSTTDLARVRHHLIGHISVAEDYTAGKFERDALSLINSNPDTPFIVVGGSGFYIQALQKGMLPIKASDPERIAQLEVRYDELGASAMHAELERRDPIAAQKISIHDRYRVIRALEICESLGSLENLSAVRAQFERTQPNRFLGRPVKTILFFPEREILKDRIRKRAQKMVDMGIVDEVRDLVNLGFGDRPGLQTVGYRECLLALRNEIPIGDLSEQIERSTLRLAKKQKTWFSRDREAFRVISEGDWTGGLRTASNFIFSAAD